MKGFTAFLKKELRELVRTKRLMVILILFFVIGIMNPATAKLTPKIMEMMAEEYADMGITVADVKITALDSWAQFVKNTPTAMIVLLIMFSGVYTSEYSKGTLIPLITKGLFRSSVVMSKYVVMLLTWSAGLWLAFGVTFFYSEYYWDNSAAEHLCFSGFCWWLFGVLMISCIAFFSSFAGSAGHVLLGTAGLYFAATIAAMFCKVKKYLPTYLMDSNSLYKGDTVPSDYTTAVIITAALSLALILAAIPLTDRRQV